MYTEDVYYWQYHSKNSYKTSEDIDDVISFFFTTQLFVLTVSPSLLCNN